MKIRKKNTEEEKHDTRKTVKRAGNAKEGDSSRTRKGDPLEKARGKGEGRK